MIFGRGFLFGNLGCISILNLYLHCMTSVLTAAQTHWYIRLAKSNCILCIARWKKGALQKSLKDTSTRENLWVFYVFFLVVFLSDQILRMLLL